MHPRPPEGSKNLDPLIWNPILLKRTLKEHPVGIYLLDPSGGLGLDGNVDQSLQLHTLRSQTYS